MYTLLFCSKRGKTILQNMYLWPDCNCFISFLYPLWCLPNTVDLIEEKSLMTPCPSNLIMSVKM